MTPLSVWWLAARPKTLWAGIAPVLIGWVLAFTDDVFHFPSALAALLGAVLIQIGTNFANDYYDHKKGADTHERIGPTRATQSGMVTPRAMLGATIFVFFLAFLIGVYLVYCGGWPIAAVGILSIIFGFLYTGGPLPIGYIGLGEVFVLIFFGLIAVSGTYWVQALTMEPAIIIAGIPPGLLSVAVLVVNNLRDVDSDKAAGKHTLAVRFGRGFARSEYFLCVIVASVTPYAMHLITGRSMVYVFTPLILVFAIPAFRSVVRSTDGPTLNQTLAMTARLLLYYTALFAIGWLI